MQNCTKMVQYWRQSVA